MSLLNITKDMSTPQGLTREHLYEAVVVHNDDSTTDLPHNCRIQARVPILFDGIPDDLLPWAIPIFAHYDGASDKSGVAFIPKIGSKVLLKFQDGSDDSPIWMGYPVDKKTQMKEMEHNYPDRVITMRLQNNAITLYDTKTNELFIRNPGDLKVYIGGNVELTVTGNVKEVIKGNKEVYVEGDLTESVKGKITRINGGDSSTSVGGKASVAVGGDWKHSTGGESSIQVSGTQVNNAAQMNDQVGGPSPDSPEEAKSSPDLNGWPGFPGGASGKT